MDLKNILGEVIFSAAFSTIKELVEDAISKGANLCGADLCGAYLCGANLRAADLRAADLRGAYLCGAYLPDADLRGANLVGANLVGANLVGANLVGANLVGANLRGADLRAADLRGADLRSADLRGADLRGVKNIPDLVTTQSVLLPEGNLVGWKKCQNGVIVKVLIPQDAKRSNSTGRKCRADKVKVLRIYGAEVGISVHDGKTEYRKGAVVTCDAWNEDRWVECGGGIHFFITRIEAENY